MSEPAVAILMSTYNGEKYLLEQVNSILNQNYRNLHLFIRDDGSNDNTLNILESLAKHPMITVLESRNNLGYKNSFLFLIRNILKSNNHFEYLAFSDQDDFWDPNKITSAIQLLEKNKTNKFRLYYSGLTFVNENLEVLKIKDERKVRMTFGSEIVRHSISGATSVFTEDLGKVAVLNDDVFSIQDGHDSLIFRLNAALNGVFIRDENNYIKFRRHNSNTSNATSGFVHKIKYELLREDHSEIKTAKYIQKYLYDNVSKNTLEQIDFLINYRQSIRNKIRLLNNKNFRRESTLMNILFMYRVLFNKI